MSAPDRTEPIADDEILYRRIPDSQGWYDPQVSQHPSPQAFRPTRNDSTGLSLVRAKYKAAEEAARGQPGKAYFVAVLRVGDLRAEGIEVIPRLQAGDPAHAELPGLTYENRRSDQVLQWETLLAERLCLRVGGPFPRLADPQAG